MNDQVISLLRYALIFAGGYLTTWFSTDEWTAISGAIITIATVGWGVWAKLGTKRVPEETLTPQQKAIVK